MSNPIRIVEVGPRDGLQNEATALTVAQRVDLITRLADCGLKTIEAGAFVSPKWVPQMADTAEVLAALPQFDDIALPVLVPNMRGMEAAIASGVKEVAVFTAASEAFNQKNINATIAESFERFAPVMEAAKAHNIKVRGYVSTIAGCPYSGKVDPAKVAEVSAKLFEMGCYEISLGDTIGVGKEEDILNVLNAVKTHVNVQNIALHLHNTFGHAIHNAAVGYDEGVRTFDASVGGLGGCPYAKGATGNVATEDLVEHFEAKGVTTGLNLDKLCALAFDATATVGKVPQGKAAQRWKDSHGR